MTFSVLQSCLIVFFVKAVDGLTAFLPFHRTTLTHVALHAAGRGFGKQSEDLPPSTGPSKTYGEQAGTRPIRDMIDSEAAMHDFFAAREEWTPLFRFIKSGNSCQGTSFLLDDPSNTLEMEDFHETSQPWRKLEAIPKDEDDKQVVAGFLDSMHQALLDIPVTESKEEDANDLQFLEEGRRMLAVSRFHVLRDVQGGTEECSDKLFSVCWSELMFLASSAEAHTGSLILLPDYGHLADLRRFADMNLLRPLEWLGVHDDFEIVSLERKSPAIRLLYKLNDMPTTKEVEARQNQD